LKVRQSVVCFSLRNQSQNQRMEFVSFAVLTLHVF